MEGVTGYGTGQGNHEIERTVVNRNTPMSRGERLEVGTGRVYVQCRSHLMPGAPRRGALQCVEDHGRTGCSVRLSEASSKQGNQTQASDSPASIPDPCACVRVMNL